MKISSPFQIALTSGLAFCLSAGTHAAALPNAQVLLDDAVKQAPLFSGVALVSQHGQVVGLAVQGYAELSAHQANTPDTLFNIASAGKMVTAEAIDGLVREKALTFDTPITRVLPELASAIPENVTIDALLQHRSGLVVAGEPSDQSLDAITNNHDLFALYAGLGLSSPGPAPFHYDNVNFILLGEVVERLSGQSYERFVIDNVLKPQKLDTPIFLRADALADRPIARPYMPIDYDTWLNSDSAIHGKSAADYTHLAPSATPSAGGGALATGADMARFISRLSEGNSGKMLCGIIAADVQTGYGRGCVVKHSNYGRRYGHTGSTAGVQARIFAYPDRGFEIVVLSNHDDEAAPLFDAIEAGLFGDHAIASESK